MSIHYIAMVRRALECGECHGTGELDAGDDEIGGCLACNGTGYGPERLGLHRVGRDRHAVLYDTPGKARGSAAGSVARLTDEAREATDARVRVLRVDTDDLEDDEHAWDDERKMQHAEARMLFWTERWERLRRWEAGDPALFRHVPKLVTEDWRLIAKVLRMHHHGAGDVPLGRAEVKRLRDIIGRVDTKIVCDMQDEGSLRDAESIRFLVEAMEKSR